VKHLRAKREAEGIPVRQLFNTLNLREEVLADAGMLAALFPGKDGKVTSKRGFLCTHYVFLL